MGDLYWLTNRNGIFRSFQAEHSGIDNIDIPTRNAYLELQYELF